MEQPMVSVRRPRKKKAAAAKKEKVAAEVDSHFSWSHSGGEEEKLYTIDGLVKETLPCTLGQETQSLIELIFSNDMFEGAMQKMGIDVKKMPPGKISKTLIARAYGVLEKLEDAITNIQELSRIFYAIIPHDFGQERPPWIDSFENVRQKKDNLSVLADIEIAQEMEMRRTMDWLSAKMFNITCRASSDSDIKESKVEVVPNPLDEQYKMLNCKLEHVSKSAEDFKLMNEYLNNTGSKSSRKCTLANLWTVDREDEGERFQVHDRIGNRKLLWHGTNIARVPAILKSGLRIMPQSRGRVGAGIYFASESSKSAEYVVPAGRKGIMFLNEVVLGKEHIIKQDDWTLTAAPMGYNSVIGKGHTEPDPEENTEIIQDGHEVIVPKGKVINIPEYNDSSFSQSEYLVYREDQCRIRYMLEILFESKKK